MGTGRYGSPKEKSNVVAFTGGKESKSITAAEAKKQARKKMPKSLTKEQKAVWMSVIPEMIIAGRFSAIYIEFFRNYSILVARMDKLLAFLEDDANGWKYTTHGRNGQQHKTRPEAAQYNDDWRKWNSMINQIGGSPATDLRFHNKQPDLFGGNPYDEL